MVIVVLVDSDPVGTGGRDLVHRVPRETIPGSDARRKAIRVLQTGYAFHNRGCSYLRIALVYPLRNRQRLETRELLAHVQFFLCHSESSKCICVAGSRSREPRPCSAAPSKAWSATLHDVSYLLHERLGSCQFLSLLQLLFCHLGSSSGALREDPFGSGWSSIN